MENTCYSCGIFTQLDNLSVMYGRQVFESLAPHINNAFSAFIGLWFAWQMGFKAMYAGDFNIKEFVPRVLLFVLIHLLLRNSDYYWSFFYIPVREAMSGIAQIMVSPAGNEIPDPSIAGLLKVVEGQVFRAIDLGFGLMGDSGWMNLSKFVYGAILAIPYIFVLGIFLAFMLEGMFKLLAVTAIAPLILAAAAFKNTQGFAVSAFRVVLNGVLTVIFAAIAMGFTITIMRNYSMVEGIPLDPSGNFTSSIGDITAADPRAKGIFWPLFILGFISVLLHLKAATLASNISGASDGPGAAAAVVGAGMATVAWAKKTASVPLQNLAGTIADRSGGDLARRHRAAALRQDSPTKP